MIIGGGVMFNFWCQIFVDVLNVCICQLCDLMKVNVCGVIFIVLYGLKIMDMVDLMKFVVVEWVYELQVVNCQLYDECFGIFIELYKCLVLFYC